MRTLFICGVCTAVLLSFTLPARADIEIQLSTDGTNYTTVNDGPPGTDAEFNSPLGSFNIGILNTESNSPGLANESNLTSSAAVIQNTGGNVATLYFKLSDTGFTLPANPGNLDFAESISGNVVSPGAANALIFQSFADPSDGQGTLTGISLPALSPNIANGTPGAFNDTASDLITSGLAPGYSFTQFFELTLDADSSLSISANTAIEPAAPIAAPLPQTGLSVLVLGTLLVGIRQFRRVRIA